MVHLKSIWELSWSPFGVCFGVHFGPSGAHFGSMLRSDSDFGLRSLRNQISGPGTDLGASLGPHVGSMLEAVGRLEGSLGVSRPI